MDNVMIGIEAHIQLNTKTKIFCGCPNSISETPNSLVCDICLGMPGSKPSFNKEVLVKGLNVSLALGCKINHSMFFSRKSYFYPDLPKNFQITQFEIPLSESGLFGGIRIRRVHMEEDPGKLVHSAGSTFVDYNRSGVPLLEVVTEPDFKSADQVRDWLNKFITVLEYLGVYFRSSEASLRADVNVSVSGGERVEVKNIGGVRDIERAINFEISRQFSEGAIRETRSWDPERGITVSTRKKETEEDYGYIFEPDLAGILVSDELIAKVKSSLPELASEKSDRFVKEYKIDPSDASILTQDILVAELFEAVAKKADPVLSARWLRRDLLKILNYNKKTLEDIKITPEHMIDLISLIKSRLISDSVAKEIMIKLVDKPFNVKDYVSKHNLTLVSDSSDLEKVCDEVISENPKAVSDFKAGKIESLNFLLGQVSRKTKGKADASLVKSLLESKLR